MKRDWTPEMGISFKPVWSDSLGAKSSCVLIRTPDVSILIDPGVAVMQPSFPASIKAKQRWEAQGARAIKKASKKADIIVISHYHYDHYFPDEMGIYGDKLLLTKNPNEFINNSQRGRAEAFYSRLCKYFTGLRYADIVKQKNLKDYPNPLDELPIARSMDFGDYNERRRELFEMGLRWFAQRVDKWNQYLEIPELELGGIRVRYPEGREFHFGKTRLRFTRPLFHGIEFSRLGWVFSTVVEHGGEKLIHSSDINGPIIEDYAEWIIQENPDILILDGPMTYMFGYLLNRVNLQRAVSNALRIIEKTGTRIIIYDHHLLREVRFRDHTREVWEQVKGFNRRVLTTADYLGKVPKVLQGLR